MVKSLKRHAHGAVLALLIALVSIMWAVPLDGAAHLSERESVETGRSTGAQSTNRDAASPARERGTTWPGGTLPRAVRLRENRGRGLMIQTWVNGTGVYSFAVDTGAGATIISERVARAAGVEFGRGRATVMTGMSGTGTASGREARVRSLAIGDERNLLPSQGAVVVTSGLPPDLDGVLDPTEGFWPLGYSIDMRRGELSAFDPRTTPLRTSDAPRGGAVVQWIFERGSRRPFVMLDGGRRALIDTGSEFGLAISESASAGGIINAGRMGRDRDGVRDIAGGRISARRVAPTTVQIGSLVLRSVPTDLLSGVVDGAPILLGREALQPFYLSFDPLHRLILITP
ncbi:MAG TPA: aspartyl protease family protein [Pyrinomonadaceae bacterium]|nr:aspartyl protease family protein [Pyrinomonadaceae bacterium]